MKMLTVRQPWASLIALGVKTIETRSWSTSYRGPLAIHAGKARVSEATAFDLSDRWSGDGVELAVCPDGVYLNLRDDEVEIAFEPGAWSSANTTTYGLALGAVVAVADLVDVLPIVGRDGEHRPDATPRVMQGRGELFRYTGMWAQLTGEMEGITLPECVDIEDQLPFGHFAPGRFAWLLDNVRAIEPVVAKGHQGLRVIDPDVGRQVNERLGVAA